MRSDAALDYAVFQLSPKRSRCELYVSGDGKTEKLASGLLKPFVSHLAVAEDQVAQEVPSIKLEVNKRTNNGTWFTKGTLERFVRFVSTPEVLELVVRIDEEMSHLEAARKIYLQGAEDQISSATGGDGIGPSTPTDITKKELLRAIDVRLVAVRNDLTTACARASAAGFTIDTISALQLFADWFGAHRLNEACAKFITLSKKRPNLISLEEVHGVNQAIGSSIDSNMSIKDPWDANILLRAECQQQTEQRTSQDQNASHHQSKHEQINSSIRYAGLPSLKEPSHKDGEKEIDGAVKKKDEEAVSELPKARRMARQLSVQDRINMFENKQKDTDTGNDGKIMTGKSVEPRRLSSDVSLTGQAVEKAVFRRWSGASDISMDLGNDKKDTESSSSTPYSTSNSLKQSNIQPAKVDKVLRDAAVSSMTIPRGPGEDSQVKYQAVSQINVGRFFGKEETSELRNQVTSNMHSRAFSERSEAVGSKDRMNSEIQPKTYFDSSDGVESKDRPSSKSVLKTTLQPEDVWRKSMHAENHIQSKPSMGKPNDFDLIRQAASLSQPFDSTSSNVQVSLETKDHSSYPAYFRAPSSNAENVGLSDQTAFEVHSKAAAFSKVDDAGTTNHTSKVSSIVFSGRMENSRSKLRGFPTVGVGVDRKDQVPNMQQPRDVMGNIVGNSRSKGLEAYQGKRGPEGDLLVPQPHWCSFPGNLEDLKNKQFGGLLDRGEGSCHEEMKMQLTNTTTEKSHNLLGRRGETSSIRVNGDPIVSRGKTTATQEKSDSAPTAAAKQVQKARLSKGNQELNELQIKANDLEKLFAAHQLRVPGDQLANVTKSKPTEMVEEVAKAVDRKPMQITPHHSHRKTQLRDGSPKDVLEHDPTLLMQIIDSQDCDSVDNDFPDNGKGKFYEMYVQKRDAKLKEDWSSNRMEKEAKMKAIRDYFESSSAEMKANFSGSSRQYSIRNAKQRAERLRSFNIRSAMKITEQDDEDEDVLEIHEHNQCMQDTLYGETVHGGGSSRSLHSKKLLTNKTTFTSALRTSAALPSRSLVKPYSSNSGRRRNQRENSLAESVPDFSDFRKENSKPLPGIGKVATRSQSRSSRSKSIGEELLLDSEEKPRSQSMRKNSTSTGEMTSASLVESILMASSITDKEQIEHYPHKKVLMNVESKPFFRKGNGIHSGSGAGIAKLKASSKLKSEEKADDSKDQFEDSMDLIQRKEEESKLVMLEKFEAVVDPAESYNEESGTSKASVKFGYQELENGELLRSLGSVDLDSDNEVSAAVPSICHTYEGPMHDSPNENLASWNSHGHLPFSYGQETSDIDMSLESPMGSPASWSSHSLTQIEADAARMRKKWSSTQKPIIVSNTSNHQTRKDVTKGFKRLLKFGRRSRGTETLADWISATTSEGDDDTEDGCDLANRSSEDLRKSRMGSLQDGFNNEELCNEQAPRSFFSLSTFRSKGNESKPR